jgi:hypothetical protein
MKAWLAILAVSISATMALAQPGAPTGPAPAFSVVRKADPEKGHLVLVRFIDTVENVPVTEKVNLNGNLVDVTKFVQRTVRREVDVVYDIGASRVINTDGKQLPIDEVWKRLKSNSVVAISGDFKTPAPAFLRALHPDTLTIILPPLNGPMAPPSKKQPDVKPGDAP